MEFYHKDDGYPMSISIETMSVDKMDDDTCLYDSIVMDMDTNKVIAEFCHDSLLGRRKWAEGFFAGLKIKESREKLIERLETALWDFSLYKTVGDEFISITREDCYDMAYELSYKIIQKK